MVRSTVAGLNTIYSFSVLDSQLKDDPDLSPTPTALQEAT